MISRLFLLKVAVLLCCCISRPVVVASFSLTTSRQRRRTSSSSSSSSRLYVSELHVPGYAQTKLPFILTEEEIEQIYPPLIVQENLPDSEKFIPYEDGYLLHRTIQPILTSEECQSIINEAEYVANNKIQWTTNRHGNYPTTDLPLIELPQTIQFLKRTLIERIYPTLRKQFGQYLPNPYSLRVADGFVVKYDAEQGQKELKPHRDGSVISFNIALNQYENDYIGGGTWFNSLNTAITIQQGRMVSHASGLLHGGHGITHGKRYILVAFVIVEGYDSWSMRFYNQIRNL